MHHLLGDRSLVAERDDRAALGVEQLAPQPLVLRRPFFGAALAAWGAGAIRTWFGGYGWAFGSAGLLCLFAVGLVLQIERGPRLVPAPATA